MHPFLLILIAALALAVLIVGIRALRNARRRRLRAEPFPPKWARFLNRNIFLYKKLPPRLKKNLHGHMQVFLHEKRFEGCGGLRMTDEIRVTIAGYACILIMSLDEKTACYPRLSSILVYPSAFITPEVVDSNGTIREDDVRLGESWETGAVVLAWDEIARSVRHPFRGNNLVYHEFAHQLDREDGFFDGIPDLEHRSDYLSWTRILGREFKRHKQRVSQGKNTWIDEYGALAPSEFFAVLTETFFEKPLPLKAKHPDLYNELKNYYKLDPESWV